MRLVRSASGGTGVCGKRLARIRWTGGRAVWVRLPSSSPGGGTGPGERSAGVFQSGFEICVLAIFRPDGRPTFARGFLVPLGTLETPGRSSGGCPVGVVGGRALLVGAGFGTPIRFLRAPGCSLIPRAGGWLCFRTALSYGTRSAPTGPHLFSGFPAGGWWGREGSVRVRSAAPSGRVAGMGSRGFATRSLRFHPRRAFPRRAGLSTTASSFVAPLHPHVVRRRSFPVPAPSSFPWVLCYLALGGAPPSAPW